MQEKPAPASEIVPVTADFSEKSMERSIFWQALTNMGVTVPTSLGAVAIAAVLAVGVPWPFIIPGFLFAGGVFLKKAFIDKDAERIKYISVQRDRLRQFVAGKESQLMSDLQSLGCEQGAAQLQKLPACVRAVTDVLGEKFREGELARMRYEGSVEQARLTMIKQLGAIVTHLKSVKHIEPAQSKVRGGKPLPRIQGNGTAEAQDELLQLRDGQLKAVEGLLSENEKVLVGLSKLAVELASVDTEARSAQPIEAVLADLDILARQAVRYSSH